MVNPQEFTSPAQKRISLIKPKTSLTLLHIRLDFDRSRQVAGSSYDNLACLGIVRFVSAQKADNAAASNRLRTV